MTIAPKRRAHRMIAAVTTALLAVVAAVAGGLPAAAVEDATPPEIVRTVSDAGFSHPGVGFTADHLENMRTQVLADVDPWASYYAAMTETRYAARDFRGENAVPGTDTPKNDAYASADMRSLALRDAIGAMTQALQYAVTGDEVYRANALHVIRTWSSLDPAKYAYFPDAHIHTGVPLYYLLIAAEIIRGTEPANADLQGYDLRWTATDQQKIVDNLVRPVMSTFLDSRNRLWNQHLYGVIGMVAAAIFLDDADLYAERVEWFTVNAGYESEHDLYGGDVNGALASLFREISADDPRNTFGERFIQHMEMLRDQAHGQGDVDILSALARIVSVQGTTLDPVDGTVSDAEDAVSAYHFLDNRILEGADTFYAFMMGKQIPFVPATEGGALSQAYRGRLQDPLSETYLQYQYVADVDVAAEAPHVAQLYEQRDGPRYYYGTGVQNFWNDRGSDYTGAEYWVAFPPELAEVEDTVAPRAPDAELAVDTFGTPLGDGAERGADTDGPGFIRLDTAADDAQLAVRRAVWSDRARTSLVGIRVRTDAAATLDAFRTLEEEPFARIDVPDTDSEWRYVWMDLNLAETPGAVGDNILFLRASGSGALVDVAGVLAQANGVLTPPTFADSPRVDAVAVAGEPWTREFPTSDDSVALEVQGAPTGAQLTGDELSWTPDRAGSSSLLVVASDGVSTTALPVTIRVAATRQDAVALLTADVGEQSRFTSSSWARMVQARTAAERELGTAAAEEFATLLEQLGDAIDALELLTPTMPDGTLDFVSVMSAPALTASQRGALGDADNQTTWGDQRVPSVVFDAGPGFRIRADAFGFQARDSFINRAEGTNAYGSDDGVEWTLLTEHPNAGQDSAIEWVNARADVRDRPFRFIKFQIDEPGVPSDPAYPGIWSIAELRIDGARSEAVGIMDAVVLESPDAVAGRVVAGDRIVVRLTGPAGNSAVTVNVLGVPAVVTSPAAGEWVATATVPDNAVAGGPVSFSAVFTTPEGLAADPIAATTDGSGLRVSSDVGLIDEAFRGATVLRPDGVADPAWTQHTARMFDGAAATHSDTRLNAGTYGSMWDFGPDTEVVLTGAELLVRQDGYGTSRIADMRLEGSDDRQTWTRLTPAAPAKTLEWQRWSVDDDDAYRYVRLVNGQILNVAELRLFGSVAPVDVTPPTVTVKEGAEFTLGGDGLYRTVSFALHDAGRIDRLWVNGVEKDLTDDAWSDLNFVRPGAFGAVEGTNALEVADAAGNRQKIEFVLDATGPKVTVKPGEPFTRGPDGANTAVSFKLQDSPGKVDRLSLNGRVKDLTDNIWSDLNFVVPGAFGAVAGANTLVVYDALGNETTLTFTLVAP